VLELNTRSNEEILMKEGFDMFIGSTTYPRSLLSQAMMHGYKYKTWI